MKVDRYPPLHLMGEADFNFLMGLAAGQRSVGTHAVEIGCFHGVTTINLARMLPNHHVLTFDLQVGQKTVGPLSDPTLTGRVPDFPADVRDRITHTYCDSAILTLPADCQIGFAFIDGNHTYDYVIGDFEKLYPRVVQGGVIAFHDYGVGHDAVMSGVKTLADEYASDAWAAFGVIAWCRKGISK